MEETHYSSAEEDLILSFQNLVISTGGNVRCLEAFQSIIHQEMDKVSETVSTPSLPVEDTASDLSVSLTKETSVLEELIIDFPNYANDEFLKSSNILTRPT